MEEKALNERESLELITRMIQETKNKLETGEGNILLTWGYVTVCVALLVYATLLLTHSPHANWLWFLIPFIGYPIMFRQLKKEKNAKHHTSNYIDKISNGIWTCIGAISLIYTVLCVGFALCGHNAWALMLAGSVTAIGFAAAAQGVIIHEPSIKIGGLFGILAGGFMACCAFAGIPLNAHWVIPLFILCFVCMTIIPGHVINRKARKSCSKN